LLSGSENKLKEKYYKETKLLTVMHNLILTKESKEISELSKKLGFIKTLFLEKDFVIVDGNSKKELLRQIDRAKGKLTIYKPKTEELLRFALEKTKVDLIYGMELINPKDSVHFVRGGLDQITCRIAAEKSKVIGFSFSDVLNARNKNKIIARMKFNVKLCKKYKVKTFFSTFAKNENELRSTQDLFSFWKVLGGTRKGELEIIKKVI
jgi:RNase P/RNase MRP subunit p30